MWVDLIDSQSPEQIDGILDMCDKFIPELNWEVSISCASVLMNQF
jgi:hypothetical protein